MSTAPQNQIIQNSSKKKNSNTNSKTEKLLNYPTTKTTTLTNNKKHLKHQTKAITSNIISHPTFIISETKQQPEAMYPLTFGYKKTM
jgi:hypothetical protein